MRYNRKTMIKVTFTCTCEECGKENVEAFFAQSTDEAHYGTDIEGFDHWPLPNAWIGCFDGSTERTFCSEECANAYWQKRYKKDFFEKDAVWA